jgi:hypothetical protein
MLSSQNVLRRLRAALLSGLFVLSCGGAKPATVYTQHNDNARTGANLSETILTPANVKVDTFGKLFTLPLDADVNGQILYAPSVTIDGTVHNVLYLTTSNNTNFSPSSAYAFDADAPNNSAPLWRHQFTPSARWTTCAPAIDPDAKILYVLTKDNDDAGPTKIHALDMTTGDEKSGSPVIVQASVPGTGDGSENGVVSFDTTHANCRSGLLVVKGSVYFGFAHNTDSFPYHGWVFGYTYDGTTLKRTAVFNACPNGGLAGVWQAGKGIAADADGNLYLTTGNGTFNADKGGSEYGMCVLKLSTPDLKVVDWYAPYDQKPQSDVDYDFGNVGPALLPGANRLFVGATKFGSGFLLDTAKLGHFHAQSSDQALQRINRLSSTSNVGQNPIVWDAGSYQYFYLWPRGSGILQLRYDSAADRIDPAGPYKKSTASSSGGSLTVTANGDKNGLLWALGYDAALRVYDASDLSKPELWNSRMNLSRDGIDVAGHFQFPTVVNGKAYIPTGAASVAVYGLLPGATVSGDLNGDGKVDITDATLSLRIAVGLVDPTDAEKKAGDADGDGQLTIRDTTLILRAAVGLSDGSAA